MSGVTGSQPKPANVVNLLFIEKCESERTASSVWNGHIASTIERSDGGDSI